MASGRISIANVDPSSAVGKLMHDADTDQNGELSLDELQLVFANYEKNMLYSKTVTLFMWALVGVLCAVVASVFGLSFAVAMMTKETSLRSNVMIDKSNKNPIQVNASHHWLKYLHIYCCIALITFPAGRINRV